MAKSTNKGIGYSSKVVQEMFNFEMKSFVEYFPQKDENGLPLVTHPGLYKIWRDAILVNNLSKATLISKSITEASKDGASLTKMFKRFSDYGLYSDFPVFLDTCMREWPTLRGVLKTHWEALASDPYPPIGKFAYLFDHVLAWYDGYTTTKQAMVSKIEAKKSEMKAFNSSIPATSEVSSIKSDLQNKDVVVQSVEVANESVGYTYLNGKKHNKYGALNRTYEEDLADAIISGDVYLKNVIEGALLKFSKDIEGSRKRVADLVKIKESK